MSCTAAEPVHPDTAPDEHRHACVGQGHGGREHICKCGEWFTVPGVGA